MSLDRNWEVMTLGMAGMEGPVPSSASLRVLPDPPSLPIPLLGPAAHADAVRAKVTGRESVHLNLT